MDCSLCKYRSTLLGFEDEVSLAQESHHHHVEGSQESCSLCESECTGDCESVDSAHFSGNSENIEHDHFDQHGNQSHSHGHHPYPNADHPLGPLTLRNAFSLPESKEI